MGTSNFGYDDVLGIIALNTPRFKEQIMAWYKDEGIERDDVADIDWDFYYEDWQQDIDELNTRIGDIEIYLESGYYEGSMLRITSTNDYLYPDELCAIINARNDKKKLTSVCRDINAYYYGISPSDIFKSFDIVRDWINERIYTKDLLNLNVAYRFSNGETGYTDSETLI